MDTLRFPDRLRRRLLLAGAALPVACATQPPSVAPPALAPPPPRVRVGQRWRYETIDVYRNAAIGELHAEVASAQNEGAGPLVVALSDARGAATGQERWARAWDIIDDPSYGTVQHFETPVPYLPDRLESGARRDDSTWYRVAGSSSRLFWRQQLRATGWERIEVPAGEFDALRVQRYINFAQADSFRELSWRTDTLWYAPEVGRWVQREWTGEYRWPGGRRPVIVREDWIRWQLLQWSG